MNDEKRFPMKDAGNYTELFNAAFDVVMPNVSANAWKLFCFIYRQTKGWGKRSTFMSYKAITIGTGIKSSDTIGDAIADLLAVKLIMVKSPEKSGEANGYALNSNWQKSDMGDKATPENGVGTHTRKSSRVTPENGVEPHQKMVHYKEKKKENINTLSSTTVIEGDEREENNSFHPQQQNIQTAEVETVIEAEVVGTASLQVAPAVGPSPEEIFAAYPRRVGRDGALPQIRAALARIAQDPYTSRTTETPEAWLLARTREYAASPEGQEPLPGSKTDRRPNPLRWFGEGRYTDDPRTWQRRNGDDAEYRSAAERDAAAHAHADRLEDSCDFATDSRDSGYAGDGEGDFAVDSGYAHRLRPSHAGARSVRQVSPEMGYAFNALPSPGSGSERVVHPHLRAAQERGQMAVFIPANHRQYH